MKMEEGYTEVRSQNYCDFFFLSFCAINRKGRYKSSLNLEKLFCFNIGKHPLKHKQKRKY